MAGDWIKMRVDLADDPSVVAIATATNLDEYSVIGRLHRIWSWADRHTVDGVTTGVDLKWVDRFVNRKGFASALCAEKWLNFEHGVLSFPGFDIHNGASAKSRCDAVLRQRESRSRRDGITNGGIDRRPIPKSFARAVLKRDAYMCVYCGGKSSPELEANDRSARLSIDHILPHSRTDGRQAIEDLATTCRKCNGEKSDRTPEEWGVIPRHLQAGVKYDSGHILVTQLCDKSVTIEKRREEYKNASLHRGGFSEKQKPGCLEILLSYAESPHCGLLEIQAREMWDHYESNGWTVNGLPIADWQASARKWKNNQGRHEHRTSQNDSRKNLQPLGKQVIPGDENIRPKILN